MNAIAYDGGCRPTRRQELLLQATLRHGTGAGEAWHEWKSDLDLDQLEPGVYHLLPQLFHNLNIQSVRDPLLDKLKGIYRHEWYKNQILFHTAADLLPAFRGSGIDTLLLGEAVLVLLHGKGYGIRPVQHLDILVRREEAPAAISLLKKLGWMPKLEAPETFIPIAPSAGFRDGAGRQLILHWRVLAGCPQARAGREFWDGAISATVEDVPVGVLNPTDQLLYASVQVARGRPLPPIVWLANAMTILTSAQAAISWSRLIALAQEYRAILPLRDMLSCLRDVLEAPIPAFVLQEIRNAPASRAESIEHRAGTYRRRFWARLAMLCLDYARQTGDLGLRHRLVGFPRFLQYTCDAAHLWQVPFYALRRGEGSETSP